MDSLIFRKRQETQFIGGEQERSIDVRSNSVLIDFLTIQDNRVKDHDYVKFSLSEFDEIVAKYLEYRTRSEEPIEELYKAVLEPIHAMLDRINGFSAPAEPSGEV